MSRISLAIVGLLVALTYSVDGYCSSVLSSLGLKGKVKKVVVIPIWDSNDNDDYGYVFHFTPEGDYIGTISENDGVQTISEYDTASGVDISLKDGRMTRFSFSNQAFLADIDFIEYNANNLPIRGRMEYDIKEYVTINWANMDSHGNYQLMNIDKRNLHEPLDQWCPIAVKWKIEYWPEGVTSASLPKVPQRDILKNLIERSNKKDVTVFSDSLRMLYTAFMDIKPNTPIKGIDSLRMNLPFISIEHLNYEIEEAPDKSWFSVKYVPSEFDTDAYWLFTNPGEIDNAVWFRYIPVGNEWRLDDVYSTNIYRSYDVQDKSIKDELTTIYNIKRYSETYPAPRLSEGETERILSEAKNEINYAIQCKDIKSFQKVLGKLLSINYNPKAQYLLGLFYQSGIGVEKNSKEAFKWFSRCAEQGDADASIQVALMYIKGSGVGKNQKYGLDMLENMAKNGSVAAQKTLGKIYEQGYAVYGVTSNTGKAKKWYEKAAKGGDAEAQYILSKLLDGTGYTLDSSKWLKKSADQGYGPAEFRIGLEYDQRDHDYEQAKYWYKRSLEHGFENARYRLTQLEQEGK